MPVVLSAKLLLQFPASDLNSLLVAADNHDEENVPHNLRAVAAAWEAVTRFAAAAGLVGLYAVPTRAAAAAAVPVRYNRLLRLDHPLNPLMRLTEACLIHTVAVDPDAHPLGTTLRQINAPHTPREVRSRCRAYQLAAAGLWEGVRPALYSPWLYDSAVVAARVAAAAWHTVTPFDRDALVTAVNHPRDGWTGQPAPRAGRRLPKDATAEAALDRLLLPLGVKLRPAEVYVRAENVARSDHHRRHR